MRYFIHSISLKQRMIYGIHVSAKEVKWRYTHNRSSGYLGIIIYPHNKDTLA